MLTKPYTLRNYFIFCVLFLFAIFLASCTKGPKNGDNTPGKPNPPVTPPVTPQGNAVVSTVAGLRGSTDASVSFTGPNSIVFDAAGNIYFVVEFDDIIYKIDKNGVMSVFAGTGSYGSANGQGTSASFFNPIALAIDAAGNIYVADSGNYLIRKITPAGMVSTYAGTGTSALVDGPLATASFGGVGCLAIDKNGNMYVADLGVLRKITPGGIMSTIPGTENHTGNIIGGYDAYYTGLTVDNDGNLYAADRLHFIIIKVTPDGTVSQFAGQLNVKGHTDGTGSAAVLAYPTRLVFNPVTNCIYVSEEGPHDIRKITLDGDVTTLAGSGDKGDVDATGTAASFSFPDGMGVDAAGNIYVGDSDNNSIRKITPAGVVTTFAGKSKHSLVNGAANAATFNYPAGVVTDASGNIYVADAGNDVIRKISSAGVVSTFAGSGEAGNADGSGTAASFSDPTGLAIDANNIIYVADSANNVLRKITASGQVSTIQLFVDNNGASGPNNYPTGVAIDAAGNIYYTNTTWNSLCQIGSKFNSTFSVGNNPGPTNGMFFNIPYGVAVDKDGNVYVADKNNSRICKINAAGFETTIAGQATDTNFPVSGYQDGIGTSAVFNHPQGVAVDGAGNVYVADTGNNLIRKITPAGVVTTLAGQLTPGSSDGTYTSASFKKPIGITVNSAGTVLYIADTGNNLIRKIAIQ